MDVQMPLMDGYTATCEIRKWEGGMRKEGTSSIPIIAMTAHAMAGDHEKSIAAGMNDHVTKPIDPAQLFATLVKWIRPGTQAERKRAEASLPPPGVPGPVAVPPPSDQTLPEVLAEFDLAEGLQRLMGNRALYRKLLVNFATQYATAAADIRSALDAADFDHAHGLVHAIKGVAGNLAAKDLQAQSVPLEKLVKHADPANPPPAGEVNPAYQAFREALIRALDAVRSLMPAAVTPAAPAETAAGALPPPVAKEAATRLREAAELGDVSGLAAICSELTAKSEAFSPYAARVARLADDFDFDGVLKLTEALEKQ
jgi:CheY-like chemotaxis protein